MGKPLMKYMDQVRSLSTKRGVGVEAMDAMGEPLMEYMHQVRSLSTKRGGPVRAMGAIGTPEMKYTHQVRSLSTKEGGGGHQGVRNESSVNQYSQKSDGFA